MINRYRRHDDIPRVSFHNCLLFCYIVILALICWAAKQRRQTHQNNPDIAKLMGPTWGPSGSCRTQMGPMLVPWTLLSGNILAIGLTVRCDSAYPTSFHTLYNEPINDDRKILSPCTHRLCLSVNPLTACWWRLNRLQNGLCDVTIVTRACENWYQILYT